MRDDDISQLRYAPHLHGGPVHLVNVCINQTHDPKQQPVQPRPQEPAAHDRPAGLDAGRGRHWTQAQGDGALTLGAWTAISGAAFAPGLGRLTKRGIAALSVFAGLRLGYWWNSAEAGIVQPAPACTPARC